MRPGDLRLTDVSLTIAGGRVLLDRINLDIRPGETLAIVGPNGAGKTSLARLLSGALKPSRGAVLLDGQPLDRLRPLDRARRIAMVAQEDQPDPRLTISDYVGLGRIPHEGRAPVVRHRQAVAHAVLTVGLDGMTGRRLATLSGGERRRAALARALAQEPDILILDEPTNHLDPRGRADILDLVRRLGITIIAVLHDLTLVSAFADRVAVLDQGVLAIHDTPAVALAPGLVRRIFAMDCFPVINPANGRALLVFDRPAAS